MRFGCCGNLLASGPDRTGIETVEMLAEYGYDYIELPLAEMMDLSDADFAALKDRVAASGLRCEVCNNFFPARIRLTGPEADEQAIQTYLTAALARAGELGVSVIVFGSAGAKRVPEGTPMDQAYQQVLQVTRRAALEAQRYGITIVIEPVRMPDCNIINTFAEGVRLAQDAALPNVKVLIDFYHMVCEHESPQILLTYGPEYLRHVHFSYPNIPLLEGSRDPDHIRHLFEGELDRAGWWRTYPADSGEWDYGEFIHCLKACGYNGRVSLEAPVKDRAVQVRQALAFLKQNF